MACTGVLIPFSQKGKIIRFYYYYFLFRAGLSLELRLIITSFLCIALTSLNDKYN